MGDFFFFPGIAAAVSGYMAYLFDEIGQSNDVSAAPISPSSDPNSVAYNVEETLTAGPMSELASDLLAARLWVLTFNVYTQAWEPFKVGTLTLNTATNKYEPTDPSMNVFGFIGNEGSNPSYVPGIPASAFFALWWDKNMAGKFLLVRRAGAVGQPLPFFLKSYGNGIDNSYHSLGSTLWGPSYAKLPALQSARNITTVKTLGRKFWQGETEGGPGGDIPNWAANQARYEADMIADNYYRPDADSLTLLPLSVVRSAGDTAVNNQKILYATQHSEGRTLDADPSTELIDDIHRTLFDMRLVGNYLVPEAFGLTAVTKKYIFKGTLSKPGNTVTRFKDQFNYHDFVAAPGHPLTLITDASTGKLYYEPSSTRSKLVPNIHGGLQRMNNTEKTVMLAVQQPVTDSTEYLLENGLNSIAPGCKLGSTITLQQYVAPVDVTTLAILAYVYKRTATTDQDGNGTVSVYRNGVLVDTKPASLASVNGNGLALFSPADDTYAQYAAKPGTFLGALWMWPGSDLSRMQAEYAEMAGEVSVGDTVAAAANPTTPVVTDQEPTGPYSDGSFAPSETGMFVQDGAFQAPDAMLTANTPSLPNALLTVKRLAGKSARYGLLYVGAETYGVTLGLNEQPQRTTGDSLFSFQISPDANGIAQLNPAYNALPTNTSFPVSPNRYYDFDTRGQDGSMYIVESAEGVKSGWTRKYTFDQTSTAELFPTIGFTSAGTKARGVHTQGMVASNVPLPNGGVFTLNNPLTGSTTRGGYASMGTAGITTANGFKVWGFSNLTQLAGGNAFLACKGFEGNVNEAFLLSVLDDSSVYARLRTVSAEFPSPTLNNQRLAYTLNQWVFWMLDAVPGKCRLIVDDVVSNDAVFTGALPEVPTALSFGGGIGSGTANKGVAQYAIIGSERNVGFGVSGTYATDAEIDMLRNGTGMPAWAVRSSSLVRQYISDLYSPDTISPANPVLILDGGGL